MPFFRRFGMATALMLRKRYVSIISPWKNSVGWPIEGVR